MKKDTERKKYYSQSLHERRKKLHVNLSKKLRQEYKKRSVLLVKGDKVKVMRGKFKGKEARVARISYVKRKVFLEGISVKNARGQEKLIPFDPSNLQIVSLEFTDYRKKVLGLKKVEKKVEKKQDSKTKKSRKKDTSKKKVTSKKKEKVKKDK